MADTGYILYVDSMIYRRFGSVVCPGETSPHDRAAEWDISNDTAIFPAWLHEAGSVAPGAIKAMNEGINLHGQIPLLFQTDINDPEQWLDAKEMADVYIEVTEGNAYGDWYVVLDELEETYPT